MSFNKKLAAILMFCAFSIVSAIKIDAVQAKDILPDNTNSIVVGGREVRKGSIAAMLSNINEFDRLKNQEESMERQKQIDALLQDLHDLAPSLDVLGMFRFFAPAEWMQDLSKEGRTLVAAIYLQHFPSQADPICIERMQQMSSKVSFELRQQIICTLKAIESAKECPS